MVNLNTEKAFKVAGDLPLKYFAQSADDALWYGQKLYPNGFTVVKAITNSNIQNLWFPGIDIGAYVFESTDLSLLTPIIP